MKIFALLLAAGALGKKTEPEDVTDFCGNTLHDLYDTDSTLMKYV
jgi:hypothetical protein